MDWGKLGEVSDWNDLDQMIEGDQDGGAAGNGDGRTSRSAENGADSNKQNQSAGMEPKSDDPSENKNVADWTDMKRFDDDHDNDWFIEEENRLAKVYGGHFIKVKYTEQGRPGYFCELCLSEMNAKKSLESHCEGMKHLKKKALWEKSSGDKDTDASSNVPDGRMGGWSDSGDRGRDRSRDRSPMRGHRNRHSPPRGRGGMDRRRDDRDFDRRGRRQEDRFFNEPPSSRWGMGRGGPPTMHDRLEKRDLGDGGQWGPPEPNAHHIAAATAAQQSAQREKLNGGTTGLLLTKLAACYIKDEEDAELALSVVSSLASSLREYNTKKGETKIAELLMEAELKLNTLKALKVGLKCLNNRQGTVGGGGPVHPSQQRSYGIPTITGGPAQQGYGSQPLKIPLPPVYSQQYAIQQGGAPGYTTTNYAPATYSAPPTRNPNYVKPFNY